MKKKKAAASAKKAGKAAKQKTGEKGRKPTPRQTELIAGIVEGKSTRQAALDAGYSERMANHPSDLLSSDVLRSFLQKRLSLEKIADRIDEGMDAELSESIVIGRKGMEKVLTNTYPNYPERRQSAALAAKLIGADPSARTEGGGVPNAITVNFIHVAALAQP